MSGLISRADAMSKCKNAENELTDEAERKGVRVARFIIGELPSEELPKGDLISRADAIEAVCKECAWSHEQKCDFPECVFKYALKAIPSADAVSREEHDAYVRLYEALVEAKDEADTVQGEWIEHTDCEGKTRTITCSKCGWVEHSWVDLNYCPSCGARMTPYKGGDTE